MDWLSFFMWLLCAAVIGYFYPDVIRACFAFGRRTFRKPNVHVDGLKDAMRTAFADGDLRRDVMADRVEDAMAVKLLNGPPVQWREVRAMAFPGGGMCLIVPHGPPDMDGNMSAKLLAGPFDSEDRMDKWIRSLPSRVAPPRGTVIKVINR